jgi:hypothetical protein
MGRVDVQLLDVLVQPAVASVQILGQLLAFVSGQAGQLPPDGRHHCPGGTGIAQDERQQVAQGVPVLPGPEAPPAGDGSDGVRLAHEDR